MRTTTTLIATAGLLLALTACSSTAAPESAPAPTTTSAAAMTPAATAADRQACVDAIADAITARPDDFDPETDSDPKPDECAVIAEDDYLDAYMDGLTLSNQRSLDERRRQRDEAASADATP